MRVTSIRFRDLLTFLAISGILLLTAGRYVERPSCPCMVNPRSPTGLDASPGEVEVLLRRFLRQQGFLPRTIEPPHEKDESDGTR